MMSRPHAFRLRQHRLPALPAMAVAIGLSAGLGWLAAAPGGSVPTAAKTRGARPKAAAGISFEKQVQPILKANCFDCHGESEPPKGKLDLRLKKLMLHGGESGPAIVPGDPGRSHLLELVTNGEMPKRARKLTPDEIETLRRWIAEGAPTDGPEPAEVPRGMIITGAERQHWAFRPITFPPVPPAHPAERVRTPIDAFLAARLRESGGGFAGEASRTALLRRASLDLTGLPPTPDEVREFALDPAPDAFERLVDRLLDSPRYGERWGRHWLDVAGYADSDGASEDDTPRGFAWKYRDWVIRALNNDLPFDRFVTEQLAGDELVPQPPKNLTPEQIDHLVATGFLRMAADGTASGGDAAVQRNAVVSDTIKIVSTGLLGLSVGCAQCHDHRYDPIPQADYYRLRAVFEPALDWKNWRTPPQRLVSLYTDADRTRSAEIEAEAAKLSAERESKQAQFIADALAKHLNEKFEEPLRSQLREATALPEAKRTPEQKRLVDDHPSVKINPGVLYQYNPKAADELKAMDARIGEIRAKKPPEDFLHVLTEVPGTVPVTHLFHRGDPNQPREKFGPGGLTVLPGGPAMFPEKDSALPTTGRRLAFARWLSSTNNPLLPRVIVNRVWMHHFGQGLVGTPADFGLNGEKPTHPELLDWLASVFTAPPSPANGNLGCNWSLKKLHRLILTSTAWRQASVPGAAVGSTAGRPADDLAAKSGGGAPYSRYPVRRLDGEALRDSILAVSGSLNLKAYGPPVPVREDAFGQIVVGIDKKEGDSKQPVEVSMGGEENRRSVYVQVRRTKPLAFTTTFDAPVMEVNCERRPSSTVAPQALMLMNSDFVLKQAAAFAARVEREAPEGLRDQVILAFQLAFSRPPTAAEMNDAMDFLRRQTAAASASVSAAAPAKAKETAKPAPPDPSRPSGPDAAALTNLCQALLSANEFLYVD